MARIPSSAMRVELLKSGWRSVFPELDLEYAIKTVSADPIQFAAQLGEALSDVFINCGQHPTLWPLALAGPATQAAFMDLLLTVTRERKPNPWKGPLVLEPEPDDEYPEGVLENALKSLLTKIVRRVITEAGVPTSVRQYYHDHLFELPPSRFNPEQYSVCGQMVVEWPGIQLIETTNHEDGFKTRLALADLTTLTRATANLVVTIKGRCNSIDEISSPFALADFGADERAFANMLDETLAAKNRMGVLTHGAPGTGKSAFVLAYAQERLAPQGYVTFILDHQAALDFMPPAYLPKVAVIIHEVDDLAPDRAVREGGTASMLQLLDGSLSNARKVAREQSLVCLLTCNTTERMDPAILRAGRIDACREFTQVYAPSFTPRIFANV